MLKELIRKKDIFANMYYMYYAATLNTTEFSDVTLDFHLSALLDYYQCWIILLCSLLVLNYTLLPTFCYCITYSYCPTL